MGGSVADVGVEHDESRPTLGVAESSERVFDLLKVVGIADSQHVPSIGEKADSYVFGEGYRVLPSMVMWLLS